MLPHDAKARKAIPLYTFLTQYFPDAIAALVKVSVDGNAQHNPGEPMHWSRGKSADQLDAAMRHLFDHGVGIRFGADGQRTLAQAAWRLLAQLQLDLEREAAVKAPGEAIDPTPTTLGCLDTINCATQQALWETGHGSVRTHQERGDAQGPGEETWRTDHRRGY